MVAAVLVGTTAAVVSPAVIGQPAGAVLPGGSRSPSPLHYGGAPVPAGRVASQRAARQAGDEATTAYRRTVGTAATGFVADVDQLQTDLRTGNVVGARTDELAAQGAYDAIRALLPWSSPTARALDGLPSTVPAGQHLTGLHLVERDLWDGGDAAPAVAALADEAPMVEELLSRLAASPQRIVRTAVATLDWVDDVPVLGREETYSHLDAVDVSASVVAARSAFADVQPLCRLVAPSRTVEVVNAFAALVPAVAALGPPGTAVDDAIPVAAWHAVGEQVRTVAALLERLVPAVAGKGPPTIYGYVA